MTTQWQWQRKQYHNAISTNNLLTKTIDSSKNKLDELKSIKKPANSDAHNNISTVHQHNCNNDSNEQLLEKKINSIQNSSKNKLESSKLKTRRHNEQHWPFKHWENKLERWKNKKQITNTKLNTKCRLVSEFVIYSIKK